MTLYIITGTSSGIGLGLADYLQNQPNLKMIGLARRKPENIKNYTHITLDLNNLEAVENFRFPDAEGFNKIVLINNAGIIGHVAPVGKNNPNEIIRTFNINTIALSLLMNSFISQYSRFGGQKIILNVSSGAARHSIASWSAYCASKAAVDMYSRVVADEQAIHAKENPVRVFSVAPGIVDSEMQDLIRTASNNDFNDVQRFIDYKKNGNLDTPLDVAPKLLHIANHATLIKDVILDVRDF